MRLAIALPGLVLLLLPVLATAGPAADEIGVHADRVLAVLDDPALRAPGQERARRQALRRVAEQAMDFHETGRRALGAHWDARSESERQTFVALFTDLLDRAFLRHIDRWDGERLVVAGDTIEGDRATVHTRVLLGDGTQVPVDLAMVRRGDRWRVWDVRAQGASLVGSYRAQFARMLQAGPYDDMLVKLRAKVDSLAP